MQTGAIHWKAKVDLVLTDEEIDFLVMTCSNHYDSTVRSLTFTSNAGLGRINGWLTIYRLFPKKEGRAIGIDELQLFEKSLEGISAKEKPSLASRLRKKIRETNRALTFAIEHLNQNTSDKYALDTVIAKMNL